MMWDHLPVFLFLVHFASCFPREKTTEKPEIPLVVNSKQRRPTHISEFTDPDTGLNPFLDLEEGRTSSEGRNVMEDERRDDQPYFDFDLVEGDAPDRRWNLEEPREPLERIPYRQPPQPDIKNYDDFHAVTTPRIIPPNPPTTVEAYVTKDMENVMSEDAEESTKTQHKVTKEEKEAFSVSQSIVIYATTAIALMTIAVLLIGACWWRRKLKTSQSSTAAAAENGEVKS